MAEKRKKLLIGAMAVMAAAIFCIAAYYWFNNTHYVITEDAKVDADFVYVTPQITGKLLEFQAEEGDAVIRDQIIGRQQFSGTAPANIEQSLIRSPINGVVIKKQANIGQIYSAGQTLAVVIDDKNIYITANIEEKKLSRIHAGQTVDIKIDEFGSRKFKGTVKSVGRAASSAFSLLPSSTSGTFTKVVQKVPVKISIDNIEKNILPGTNAVVKIHIK